MQALIYKSTGSWYVARTDDGHFYDARIKGALKLDDITSTNPLAVGDWVEVEKEDGEENTVIITRIEDRKNYIVRASPHQNKERHIVAANLDQLLLFASLRNPKTATGFMDRFLVSAEAWHVPSILVFNKTDLYRPKEQEQLAHIKEVYEPLGYPVMTLSMETKTGTEALKDTLKGKTTLISGQSGVGKTTFINSLLPAQNLKVQEVSGWSGKGQHTTTFAQMFDLPGGGRLIDTPGIREFGITNDIPIQELSHYFPEMRNRIHDCKFNNCLHINEPGCAIKEAVENGEISLDRYLSYYNILESLPKLKY